MSTSSVKGTNQTGEIASILILASLITMVVGALVGSNTIVKNKVDGLFGKAQTNCSYESSAQIRIGGAIARNLTGFEYESKQYPSGMDFPPKRGSFPENPKRPGDMEIFWRPNPLPNNYVERTAQTELFLPTNSNYRIKNFFCSGRSTINTGFDPCLQVRRDTNNPKVIRNIPLLCGMNIEYGWEIEPITALSPTPTAILPPLPTTTGSTPTPTIPAPTPCYFKSNINVVDENGTVLNKSQLGDPSKWKLTNSKGQISQFGTLSGNTTDLVWRNDKIVAPKIPATDVLTASTFVHNLPPTTKELTNLTLSLDDSYDIVQRKINTHCQQGFDVLNGTLLVQGCNNVNDKGELQGGYVGVLTGGDPKTIPNLSVQCNMEIDAQWKVKKRPVDYGSLQVQVQLSAGDLSKNIPFTTRKVPSLLNSPASGKPDDFNPYDGRSSVTITGTDQSNSPFTKTTTITSPTQTITGIPIGNHTISYNFPVGVMATHDKNNNKTQVYRINSPPIDGTKVVIQKDQTYNYRIIYNINSGACKAVRNPSSCTSCNGNSMDDINNPAWPHPNGKSLCCPDSKDRSKFTCSDNFDSRCTPGTFWYGNCNHYDATSQKFCAKNEKGRYTCIRQDNGETYWGNFTCVTDNSCGVPPTSTPRPQPTRRNVPTGIQPTHSPIITGCMPQANILSQDNTLSQGVDDQSDQTCKTCCQNNIDCRLTDQVWGNCVEDKNAPPNCKVKKTCVYNSCPDTKRDIKNKCDSACCSIDEDCTNGESCMIGNGNCRAGKSCCREGKVDKQNQCNATCCDDPSDCSSGNKCGEKGSGPNCKSGRQCSQKPKPHNIEVRVENRTEVKSADVIVECIKGECMKLKSNETKKVEFNPNMRSAKATFNVDEGRYLITIDNVTVLAQRNIFQIVKSAFAAPPSQIIAECGEYGVGRDGKCEVTPNGNVQVTMSICVDAECNEMVTPTPQPPVTPPAEPPIGGNDPRTLGSNSCDPANLIKMFDGDDRISQQEKEKRARDASCICQAESASVDDKNSRANCLNDGDLGQSNVYALGLFQVENWAGGRASVQDRCDDINGSEIRNGLEPSGGFCRRKPGNEGAWDACKQKWHTPKINIEYAFTISGGFSQWCGTRFGNGRCAKFSTADSCGLGDT